MKRKSKQMQRLYYSISEVAKMFDVNESTLRFWEKEFPQIAPKKAGRGIRQYRKEDIDIIQPRKTAKGTRFYRQEDIESVRLIYHLVKEKGLTLAGARQQLKENPEQTVRQEEIIHRLKQIKEELLEMKAAFEGLNPQG